MSSSLFNWAKNGVALEWEELFSQSKQIYSRDIILAHSLPRRRHWIYTALCHWGQSDSYSVREQFFQIEYLVWLGANLQEGKLRIANSRSKSCERIIVWELCSLSEQPFRKWISYSVSKWLKNLFSVTYLVQIIVFPHFIYLRWRDAPPFPWLWLFMAVQKTCWKRLSKVLSPVLMVLKRKGQWLGRFSIVV